MSERLRDLFDADDPAVVELARLVRATEIDPKPGAQERVRAKLSEQRSARLRWRQPVVVLLVLVIVTPALVAGVRRLAPRPAEPVLTPPRELTTPATLPREPGRRAPAAPDELPPATERAAPDDGKPPAAAATRAPTTPSAAPPTARPAAATPSPTRAATTPTKAAQAASTIEVLAPTTEAPAPAPAEPTTSREPAGSIAVEAARSMAPAPTPEDPRAQASTAPVDRSMAGLRGTRLSRAPLAEGALVLRALSLLRHDHDPRAALRELDAYRTGYPQGDLGEEVLALTIEARAALDDPSARPLAEQYLQQFPRGRFAEMAERAVRRFPAR